MCLVKGSRIVLSWCMNEHISIPNPGPRLGDHGVYIGT